MHPNQYDLAVVGGGIIGLATSLTIQSRHPKIKIVVVEKEPQVGLHQTMHNSGVIHAGLYYAPGSQKANFCSTGSLMLRRFCDDHGITYRMCGKVVVALKQSQLPALETLLKRGSENGVNGLEMIGPERLRELEPYSAGIRAIHSPNTGIVNFNEVARKMCDIVQNNGGALFSNTKLTGIIEREGKLVLETSGKNIIAESLINCGGLHADSIARMMNPNLGIRIIPFRGEYFSLSPARSSLVRGLIYPVPDPDLPFLGVHFTKRIDGSVEAGPNAVLSFAREGYSKTAVDVREILSLAKFPGFWKMLRMNWSTGMTETYRSLVKRRFLKSLQELVPTITASDLSKPGAGVRAQAVDRDGKLLQDFSILTIRKSVHVINAPSPGATSSLAIGNHIASVAETSLNLSDL